MKRPLTIAAVQLPSVNSGGSNAARQRANFDTAESYLKEAGQRGANIACLGENFNMVGIEAHPEKRPAPHPTSASGTVETVQSDRTETPDGDNRSDHRRDR